jgi:hypothetical protein
MAKVVPDIATVRVRQRVGAALCPQATMTRAALAGRHLCRGPSDPATSTASAGKNTSGRPARGRRRGPPGAGPLVSAALAGPLESETPRPDRPGTTNHGGKNMRKAIVTGALLITTFGEATAVGAAAALPAAASPGCGITIHVKNNTTSAIKVQWDKSDSRAKLLTGPGWWKKFGSGSTTIQASSTGSKAFTLDFSCSTKHQYRVHYTRGSSSGYAYYPGTSSRTTKSSFTVKVK